jgi:hypothetical protein
MDKLFKIQTSEIDMKQLCILDFKGRAITKHFSRSEQLFEMINEVNNKLNTVDVQTRQKMVDS